MYDLLKGMRVVEGSSFVASPSCGLYLLQMGAEVIRFDDVRGGPDARRWPLDPDGGASLYWEGLNKGKKSIALDLGRPEGRELAQRLVCAPGEDAGLFVTNYPLGGFLSYERLAALRPDLIAVRVMGSADGTSGLDYTVNAAVGLPFITGPAALGDEPVNHVLPAWDLLTGAYAAFALVAAESNRRRTGAGGEIRVPLADIAITTVANLGQLAEVIANGRDRERYGNAVYGAFGRDFTTADGRRMMVMAITAKQWRSLQEALGVAADVDALERELGVSFAVDEGIRFRHRDRLFALVEQAIAIRDHASLAADFDRLGVCWGPFRTMSEAARDPALVTRNPIFADVGHPGGRTYPTPGAAATLPSRTRSPAVRASRLGEHTDEVLADVLDLSSGEIGALHDAGIVAGAAA